MRSASRRLPVLVAAALAVQLTGAAGALAGPWAVPPPVPGPVAVQASTAGAVDAATAPRVRGTVRLSSALWAGARPLVPLGLDREGALEVPGTADGLGWWADGPRPGEAGAAVVVGHVDLDGRAGAFAALADAQPGDVVVVEGAGDPVRFRVTAVEQVSKQAFPSDEVYEPVAAPELRLITCGGRFDPRTGHYADNVVVRAVLA